MYLVRERDDENKRFALKEVIDPNERELTPVTTDGLAGQQPTPRFQRRDPWHPLILSFLVIGVTGVLGISLLFSLFWRGNMDAHLNTRTAGIHTTGLATASSVTQTPASILSPYPKLALSYGGTIGALIANRKTELLLTNIQQHQQNIQGTFTGLGLVGPFKGTVSTAGNLRFTVIIYGASMAAIQRWLFRAI